MKRGRLHTARRWTRLLATPLFLLVALLTLAAPALARPTARNTPTTPTTPAATATPAPGPSASGRSLNIGIQLGKLKIGVDLPLTLPGLLGRTAPAPSSAPPSTARPTTVSPYPPTMPNPVETPGATRTHSAPARHPTHAGSSSTTSPPASASSHPSSPPTSHKPPSDSGEGFVKRLVPAPGVLILIVLCALCAVGVAFVVRLSGGRRRL